MALRRPITGASADEGAFQIKAIKLAVKQINAAGGVNGKQINLIIVDNQSTNPGALAALQKAVEQEKVLALVGSVKSTQVLAMSDAIKNYGIPTIIGGTNATLTRQGNPWLFRVRPDDSIAAVAMVKYIKEDTKFTKVGILHDSDAFGTGGADLVEKYAKEARPEPGEAGEVHYQGQGLHRTAPLSQERRRRDHGRCTARTPRTWR